MNEVAISYCSVKRVCKRVYAPERGRGRQVKRQYRVATEALEKDGKAALIVQVLFVWRPS